MSEPNPDLQPVILSPNTKQFEADGHLFHVQHDLDLPLIRNRYLEKYSLFAALGRHEKALIAEMHRAYQANNESRPGDVAVILDNLIRGTADLLSRETPVLYICTLFINRHDEDTKTFDPEFATQKIESWKKAGIANSFFLASALSFLKISDENLNTLTQISLGSRLPTLDVLRQDHPQSPSQSDSN
ncbi:hypothetical protein [Spirosoma migulaei]